MAGICKELDHVRSVAKFASKGKMDTSLDAAVFDARGSHCNIPMNCCMPRDVCGLPIYVNEELIRDNVPFRE